MVAVEHDMARLVALLATEKLQKELMEVLDFITDRLEMPELGKDVLKIKIDRVTVFIKDEEDAHPR